MKILICPDDFKGTLSAEQVAKGIEQGMKKSFPDAEFILNPLADGGTGTVDVLKSVLDCVVINKEVKGPLGQGVDAFFLIIKENGKKTALIEMAKASGITLIKTEERNPMIATTYGTGQLITEALEQGCKKIILFIGGSATNDAGVGMMQALGFKFLDEKSQEITYRKDEGYGGGTLKFLGDVRSIDDSDADS